MYVSVKAVHLWRIVVLLLLVDGLLWYAIAHKPVSSDQPKRTTPVIPTATLTGEAAATASAGLKPATSIPVTPQASRSISPSDAHGQVL